MSSGRVRLSITDARALAEGALRAVGLRDDEAQIIADHVIDAAMCGYEYSGLAKILNVAESEHFREPRRPMRVLRETEVSLAFDGGNNVGMLALFHAAQATIGKAAAHGMALVSVTNAWMSGRSAYYVEMIARAGLVAIHTAASSPPGPSATPSGSGSRKRSRSITSVIMKAEVPMSSTMGPREEGTAIAIGLVPSAGRLPPGGATSGELAAVWIATRPALAIIST